MAENLAQASDVQKHVPRPLTTDETTDADSLLEQAWDRLTVLVPDLESRVDARTLKQSVVTGVQAEMVANVMKNRDNLRSRQGSYTVDDYTESETLTYDNAVSSGQLFPTDQHLTLLRHRPRGAFTITPS